MRNQSPIVSRQLPVGFALALALLFSAQGAAACEYPLFAGASKKAQEIRSWAAQDREITKEQMALRHEFGKDEQQFQQLHKQIQPRCVEGQGNSCVGSCQGLSAEQLSEASVIEDGYHYMLPKAKRNELMNQQDTLEKKWMEKQ